MWIRTGNLVRHKVGGGPIMYVELAGTWGGGDAHCSCVWVEDRMRTCGMFRAAQLYTVHADGTPRNYDEEN
jgi:hypothetical protein